MGAKKRKEKTSKSLSPQDKKPAEETEEELRERRSNEAALRLDALEREIDALCAFDDDDEEEEEEEAEEEVIVSAEEESPVVFAEEEVSADLVVEVVSSPESKKKSKKKKNKANKKNKATVIPPSPTDIVVSEPPPPPLAEYREDAISRATNGIRTAREAALKAAAEMTGDTKRLLPAFDAAAVLPTRAFEMLEKVIAAETTQLQLERKKLHEEHEVMMENLASERAAADAEIAMEREALARDRQVLAEMKARAQKETLRRQQHHARMAIKLISSNTSNHTKK